MGSGLRQPPEKRWSGWLLVGLMAAGTWPACRSGQDSSRAAVQILGVVDHASGGQLGVHFNSEQAQALLAKALEDSKEFRLVDKPEAGAYQAELSITLASERESQRSEEQGVYRAVQVNLALSRWNSSHERERFGSEGKAFQVQDPRQVEQQEGFETILELAIRSAVEYADLQVQARAMPLAQLEALLSSPGAEERLYALRTLRDRPAPDLIPRVIELLQDVDPEVALEAVGVLVGQRDFRAVLPLIRAAQGRDQVFLLQNITALGEIGGPVAQGYLFTLAAGHTSSVIRQRAEEALRQVERELDRSPEAPRAATAPRTVQDPEPDERRGTP